MGSHRRLNPPSALWFLLALAFCSACRTQAEPPPSEVQEGAPQLPTPDRVGPGVLLEGETLAFGFRAPRDLTLVAHFGDAAHFEGKVRLADLEDYIRTRVVARHVEVTEERSVFPQAKIRGGDPERTYRFEILPKHDPLQLVVRDVTPAAPVQGITQEERWRRAGVTPQGKLISPHELD